MFTFYWSFLLNGDIKSKMRTPPYYYSELMFDRWSATIPSEAVSKEDDNRYKMYAIWQLFSIRIGSRMTTYRNGTTSNVLMSYASGMDF